MRVLEDSSVSTPEEWHVGVRCGAKDKYDAEGCGALLEVQMEDLFVAYWHGTHFAHYYTATRCPLCLKLNRVIVRTQQCARSYDDSRDGRDGDLRRIQRVNLLDRQRPLHEWALQTTKPPRRRGFGTFLARNDYSFTASFSAFPAVKRGRFVAGTCTTSPVRGLRASRALASFTRNTPKPAILTSSPPASACVMPSKTASTARLPSEPDTPSAAAILSPSPSFVMKSPPLRWAPAFVRRLKRPKEGLPNSPLCYNKFSNTATVFNDFSMQLRRCYIRGFSRAIPINSPGSEKLTNTLTSLRGRATENLPDSAPPSRKATRGYGKASTSRRANSLRATSHIQSPAFPESASP